MAPVQLGDKLPADFLTRQRKQRITKALAELLIENGYCEITVADIVRRAGIARNTFYDTFLGKEDAARALLMGAYFSASVPWPMPLQRAGLTLLALEVVARWKIQEPEAAAKDLGAALGFLQSLPAPPVEGTEEKELRCVLPPGRHGLSRQFVLDNQGHRLLLALAKVITEKGWCATTIGDIVATACVSRRTFYEHFEDKHEAALALTARSSEWVLDEVTQLGLNSGLGILALEVLAGAVPVASAEDSLRLLLAQLETSVLEAAA